jgi:peroxiredoxin family protein
MNDETKFAYVKRLSALEKKNVSVETNTGYTLLIAHDKAVAEDDLSAYDALEAQKETLAASIANIQDIALSQKEIQSKLADIKKARKECLREQISAHEALGEALYGHYSDQFDGFFAASYAEILTVQERIQAEEEARAVADIDDASKNLFTRFISSVRASSRDIALRRLAGLLKKLYIKAGRIAEDAVTLLAESDSLDAGILSAIENCKDIQGTLADLAENETALSRDFEANIEALKDEGVIGFNLVPVRIAEINRQINAKTAEENTLAAKAGKAYLDTLLTEEGKSLKKADKEKTADPLVAEAAEIRNKIAQCKLSIDILDISGKIDGVAKTMRQGNERILDNQTKIKRLTEENSTLEVQIAEANEQRKELVTVKADWQKRLEALEGQQ